MSHGYAVAMSYEAEIGSATRARVPDHVVYRTFATETVILNALFSGAPEPFSV